MQTGHHQNIDESVNVSSQFVLVRGDTLVDNTVNENVVARGDTESTCTVDSGVNIQSLVHTESVVGDPAVDNTINEIVVGKVMIEVTMSLPLLLTVV